MFDAVRAAELSALPRIARMSFELPAELEEGRTWIRSSIDRLAGGDMKIGLELTSKVATRKVPGWNRVLDSAVRSRAHRLAALFTIRLGRSADEARGHLDAAISLDGGNALNYAERAALSILEGALDQAAGDAQQAIDLDKDEPAGFLMLGTWAELRGDFEDAKDQYEQATRRMTMHALESIPDRWSLVEPSGLLLAVASEVLLSANRPDATLALADAALAVGVRGRALHSDAGVHRLRSQALGALGRNKDAAVSAVEAAERYLWSGDPDSAISDLRRAVDYNEGFIKAQWLLADALTAAGVAASDGALDWALLDEARDRWERCCAAFGPPKGPEAWAYLTRAQLSSVAAEGDEQERSRLQWSAVVDCERAIVHEATEGQRWGFLARCLRQIGLDELAFEAVEHAYALEPPSKLVLDERLALLVDRGQFDAAYEVALNSVDIYGEDPWVAGVQALLAYHRGEYRDALALLDVPLSLKYDLSWYLDLHALCSLALRDAETARCDYLDIVGGVRTGRIPLINDQASATMIIALTLTGEFSDAMLMLDHARGAGLRDDFSFPALAALIAFAEGRPDVAERRMLEAVQTTTNGREIDDLVVNTRRRLELLPEEFRESAFISLEVLENNGGLRRPRNEKGTQSLGPEVELTQARAQAAASTHGLDGWGVLAIDARRNWVAGNAADAARGYQQLIGSPFEPEARLALVRALGEVSRRAVGEGRVDDAREAQQRLMALGDGDLVDEAIAVAWAYHHRGDIQGAHEALSSAAAATTTSSGERLVAVEKGLGELELASDDATAATRHFQAALEVATTGEEDPARIAQLEARGAMANLIAGRPNEARVHVSAALSALRNAGAFEAGAALLQEARNMLGQSAHSDKFERALGALDRLIDRSGDVEDD